MSTSGGETFRAAQVADRVYWVGAIDWGLRDFHGYQTSEGSTYNAYLILADRITLVDAVKAPFMDEMMMRIRSVIDPADIDCVVSNHAEMDHSGGLPQLIAAVQPAEVLASRQGIAALAEHFDWDVPVRAVGDGERVDLGGAGLRFIETRMLHWPDSMFTYLEGEGVLFSSDAFGMHVARTERFADEVDEDLCWREAAKYYANILLPYSALVTKLIDKLPDLELDVRVIAPDHGPIWRQEPLRIVARYAAWARQPFARKAVVVFDTMWNSTERMAHAVSEGLHASGQHVTTLPLHGTHRSAVITELLEAGALLVGSPTLNGSFLPSMADVLNYVTGLKPRNLVGAAFGSYGWGGQSVGLLERELAALQVTLAAPGLKVRYVPTDKDLVACRDLGARVGQCLEEKLTATS